MYTKRFCVAWVVVFLLTLTSHFTLPCRAEAVFTELHCFGGPPDGAIPNGSLILDGSYLYGTTAQAGSNGGVVFSISTNGLDYRIVYSLTTIGLGYTNGTAPLGTLLLSDGNLYGTTSNNGTNGLGTIFTLSTNGPNVQVVHTFDDGQGGNSKGAVVQDNQGTLYGMTSGSAGTAYSVRPDGSDFRVLHTFTSVTTNGFSPQGSFLRNGATLYGMTANGGSNGNGTAFSMTTNGANFKIIHNFFTTTTNGATPGGSLIRVGPTLYGMTQSGGANGKGTVFSILTNGASFKLLHSFDGDDGSAPFGDLTVSGPVLYGLTSGDGTHNEGTAFMLTTNGSNFELLHTFIDADGKTPKGSLLLADSVLYGLTSSGGTNINRGVLFSLTITNGFVIAPTIECTLSPSLATNIIGDAHTVVATVTSDGTPSSGALINFDITSGPNLETSGTATTAGNGTGSFTYNGSGGAGTDLIRAISLSSTGFATSVWISTNTPPVQHDLAVITLKAPKKISLSDKKPSVTGKFTVAIQNNGAQAETIENLSDLADLVTLNIQSLGSCTNPVVHLEGAKLRFPITLAPKKKLNISFTAPFSCANDPAASSKTVAHNDYLVTAKVHAAAILGGTDTVPANDNCPHNPVNGDKGCGGKNSNGTPGADVFIDVVSK